MSKLSIKVGEKNYDMSYGLGVIGEVIGTEGLTLDNLEEKVRENPIKYIPLILFASASYELKKKGEQMEINSFQFAELTYESGVDTPEIRQFFTDFWASLQKDVPIEEGIVEEGSKKK